MAVCTALAALSQLATLSTMGNTLSFPASALTSSAVRLTHSSLTSTMATRAPAAVSANVMRRPNPMGLPAPVTNATFPSNGLSAISGCLLFVVCRGRAVASAGIRKRHYMSVREHTNRRDTRCRGAGGRPL